MPSLDPDIASDVAPRTATAALTFPHTAMLTHRRAAPIVVHALTPDDRPRLIAHFLALAPSDRVLRFGRAISDRIVVNYVAALDFDTDSLFGVFDAEWALLGVAHLATLRPEGEQRAAELGVSVGAQARGQGIGSRLFERAAIRCRNTGLTSLYMHCLSHNGTMMRIATRAGMRIKHCSGEADAYLALAPADSLSRSLELRIPVRPLVPARRRDSSNGPSHPLPRA